MDRRGPMVMDRRGPMRRREAWNGRALGLVSLVALMAATGGSVARAQGTGAEADANASTLSTVVVEGEAGRVERGDGPVDGYIATRSRTGTKTDTPLSRTPQSVQVVPREQMEDQAVRSVAEALRYTPGVFTEYRGESNLNDEMFMRGYFYTPRYLDGLEYGSNSLGQVDTYLLERVEVIKGPSSVLYGQSNPGGLVNLVTKRPTGQTGGEVELLTGTGYLGEGRFDVQGLLTEDGSLAYRVVGVGSRVDLVEDGQKKERLSVAPSLLWTPNEDTSVTLSGFYTYEPNAGFRNFREWAGTGEKTSHGYIPMDFYVSDDDFQESEREQASFAYEVKHRFNDTFALRQNARFNHIDFSYATLTWGSLGADEETISRTASGGREELTQFLVDNQLVTTFDTGPVDHTLLTGFDFKYSRKDYVWGFGAAPSINWRDPSYGVGDIALSPSSDESTEAWQAGLYAQEQLHFGGLTLSLGGRSDWASTSTNDNLTGTTTTVRDQAFTGRVGAIYNLPFLGISPFVSYSTSFQPELTSAPAGQDPFEPTTAQQIEAGVKIAPEGSRVQGSFAFFDITQQNVLFYDYATSAYFQTGEIRSRGVEAEVRAEPIDNLNIVGAYSYLWADVTESVQSDIVGKMPARMPKHQASLWGKYTFDQGPVSGLGLGAGVRYIGESWGDASNSFRVDGVTLFDATVDYDLGALSNRLEGTSVQVNATNLADTEYVASCSSRYACWYGTGRTVVASLKYKW
jgi:iron complex outermembrane receptor protein